MQTGRIVFYNKIKCFGFISYDNRRVFFHMTGISKGYDPKENDKVEFDLYESERSKGQYEARNVKLIH